MGHMISHLSEIDNLNFRPFPRRPVPMRLIKKGGVMVGVSGAGNLYTNARLADKVAFTPSMYPWLKDLLTCLTRLDIIPKTIADEYKDVCEAVSKRGQARCLLDSVDELKNFGVHLSHEQLYLLKHAAGTSPQKEEGDDER